jgi:hypothetical protein
MELVNTVNFLRKFRQEDIYKLFLLDEHTDEEFEDMDEFIQSNNNMLIFLNEITYNPSLFLNNSIKKYFELHYDEPKEYLTNELLMLLYYMSDTNDMDTSGLSKELKDSVNDTINIFKELIQLENENILNHKIKLFNELLCKTLPMACNHMTSVAETFDKSNMYQQMIDNFGKINTNFDKYLDTMLPSDNEKENFLKIINELTKKNDDIEIAHSNDDIEITNRNNDVEITNSNEVYEGIEITDDIINKEIIDNYDEIKISDEDIIKNMLIN